MKLAFSSNAYMHFSIEETIARIGDCGYSGLEILADVPHAWPAGLLEERKDSIRESLAQYKLTISNINAFMMNAVADPRQPYWHPGWTDPDPHYRAIRREHTKRCLQLAADLGARNITTEPGGLLAQEQSWQQGADIFYEELMPCIELAEQLQVDLLIEPEPELLIETFGQYLEFVDRIDSKRVDNFFTHEVREDHGFRMQDSGCRLPEHSSRILHPVSRVLYHESIAVCFSWPSRPSGL